MSDYSESSIDPALEARIVALVLGQASAFEAEELELFIETRPELQAFKSRLEQTHGLLVEAEGAQVADDGWRLSEKRRNQILTLKKERREEEPPDYYKRFQWRVLAGAAACLFITFYLYSQIDFAGPLEAPQVVSYSVPSEEEIQDADVVDAPKMVEQEILLQEARRASDELLYQGRESYAEGKYEIAHAEFQKSLEKLPGREVDRERKFVIEEHLRNSGLALSQTYRRSGQYDKAHDLLAQALPESEMSAKDLSYLDDPIRTNPALSQRETKKLDEVRRSLYTGEGYYDLGLFDEAEKEFKKTLKIDPYNKAARRWLERTASIKSDYYRSAYDHTRAEMLAQVDNDRQLTEPSSDESRVSELEAEAEIANRDFVPSSKISSLPDDPMEQQVTGVVTAGVRSGSGEISVDSIDAILNARGREVISPKKVQTNVQRKPSAPAASMAEVIASNSVSPSAVPVPEVSEPEVSTEFGDGDGFGDGWGDDSRSAATKPSSATKAQSITIPLELLSQAEEEHRERVNNTDSFGGEFKFTEKIDVEKLPEEALNRLGISLKQGAELDYDSLTGELSVTASPKDVALLREVLLKEKVGEEKQPFEVETLQLTDDALAKVSEKAFPKVSDEADPFGDGSEALAFRPRMSVLGLLEMAGYHFPKGSDLNYQAEASTLKIRTSEAALAKLKKALKDLGALREKEVPKPVVEEAFEVSTAEKTDSTFSLNVSDVSFKLAKSALAAGRWPEAERIRPEQFYNAVKVEDRTPTQSEKVACVIEQGAHPVIPQRELMRVAMKTSALGRNASTPLRLTILLDQSGSMARQDRAESVARAIGLLLDQLTELDEISLVGFARTPRLLAQRVRGDEAGELLNLVTQPLTEGGTNLEEALKTGLQMARQQFLAEGQNRVILLTDGAANLGDAMPERLARQVAKMREEGIAFDACGVGADGLNDEVLTSLTKQGDGRYYFLDRPEDADEGFANQIAGALRPAAKNVKVQVLFNPDRVKNFKLYGFEEHRLNREDFRNDQVDAAEMAAEESGVALYHYETDPAGEGEIGTVAVRFLDPASGLMVERTWDIPYQEKAIRFEESPKGLQLAAISGLFAERLRGSVVGQRVELSELAEMLSRLSPKITNQVRAAELKTMMAQAIE